MYVNIRASTLDFATERPGSARQNVVRSSKQARANIEGWVNVLS